MKKEEKRNDLLTEVNDDVELTQIQGQTAINMAELSTNIKELEVIKQDTAVFDQKSIMNALVTINKLPVELFTYIISLAKPSLEESHHPYLSYTWVCRHWRSVLTQTSAFWTLIRSRRNRRYDQFDQEFFERSGSAKLDIMIQNNCYPYATMLQDTFTGQGNRIRNLVLGAEGSAISAREDLSRLLLSGGCFPSLTTFVCRFKDWDISPLLAVLMASDHLETLQLDLWQNIDLPMNQLALIFNRIRNLRLTMFSETVIPSLQALLRNGIKVQKLRIENVDTLTLKVPISGSNQAILPELRFLSVVDPFLLDYLRAPKLTSLDVGWRFMSDAALNYNIMKEFDFSSIRYLYIRGSQAIRNHINSGYCILASKARMNCHSMIPHFIFEDTLSHDHSHDCFHLEFENEETFNQALREITLLVLPRLINLIELNLLYRTQYPHTVPDFRVTLPELQSISVYDSSCLLENIQAPKLSSLDVNWQMYNLLKFPIIEDFDFSSIRYLYIRGPQSLQKTGNCCILGSNERMRCETFHSVLYTAYHEPRHAVLNDKYPPGCFHFEFNSRNTFVKRLSDVATLVLSQLTTLVELYFLSPHTLLDFRIIVTQIPSVEKMVVQCGNKLISFIHLLSKPSVCPRLQYLSCTTSLLPKNLERYAENVGKTLTSCLQSRQKGSAYELKYIALRNCPPLSDVWLQELRNLGPKIVTEKDAKNVTMRSPESHRRHMKEETFSDVEI